MTQDFQEIGQFINDTMAIVGISHREMFTTAKMGKNSLRNTLLGKM